jgi:alpha-ketoglutarate-dependent taurine dioxygenase
MAIEARPIGDLPFGVRLRGVTDERLSDAGVRRRLRAALAESGLVILEDVEPSHRLQGLVGEVFGALKDYRDGAEAPAEAGRTFEVAEMVTGPDNCTIVEIGGRRLSGWMPWHFDQPYNPNPNPARVLRCGRVVPSGGLTGFLDGADLYRRLDPALRAAIEPCRVDYAFDLTLEGLRFGIPPGYRVVGRAGAARAAGAGGPVQTAAHPAVRLAPSGQKVLHVSPWMATGLVGGGDDLLEAVAQEILTLGASLGYFHQWRPSDIVIWDNLRMLHSSSGFDPAETRVMYRTTVKAA